MGNKEKHLQPWQVETKFTPGEWHVNPALAAVYSDKSIKLNLRGDDSAEICNYKIGNQREIREPESMANLFLIAAAPDMYKELAHICQCCDGSISETGKCRDCRISKILCKAAHENLYESENKEN